MVSRTCSPSEAFSMSGHVWYVHMFWNLLCFELCCCVLQNKVRYCVYVLLYGQMRALRIPLLAKLQGSICIVGMGHLFG